MILENLIFYFKITFFILGILKLERLTSENEFNIWFSILRSYTTKRFRYYIILMSNNSKQQAYRWHHAVFILTTSSFCFKLREKCFKWTALMHSRKVFFYAIYFVIKACKWPPHSSNLLLYYIPSWIISFLIDLHKQ